MEKIEFKKTINAIMFTTGAAILVAGVVLINGCKKESANVHVLQTMVDDESEAMVAHILEFKERMAYYHENPNLKSGGKLYSASEAVVELENLLNYNFCYTDSICSLVKSINTEIVMPLDEVEKINDPKLMEVYYDRAIDTIQAIMGRVNYSNMILLLVDLDVSGTDSNGDAIISVGIVFGNRANIPPAPSQAPGWWYGNEGGDCEHDYFGQLDATMVLTDDITAVQFPAPPPGKVRIVTELFGLDPLLPWDYFLVNPEYRDNFEDSKLFYAEDIYGTITDNTCCLTTYTEMTFYAHQYNQLILTAEEVNNLDFTRCVIEDYTTYDGNGDRIKIWHTLRIYLGHVSLIDTFEKEDILYY
ncbi:MAG: hypothetical protein WC341_05655 [Bacteroidales bacterium]|jgi:hypothetical protein